jgi:hypothetical protein
MSLGHSEVQVEGEESLYWSFTGVAIYSFKVAITESQVGKRSVFWAALSKWKALSLLRYVSQQLSIDQHSEK